MAERCGEDYEGRICDRAVEFGECPIHGPVGPEPEPSREDRYEAAVRAVLDLCDEADRYGAIEGSDRTDGLVSPDRIRDAVRAALPASEEPDGDREPVVVSGPGAGTERIPLERIVRGPGPAVEIVELPGGHVGIVREVEWP